MQFILATTESAQGRGKAVTVLAQQDIGIRPGTAGRSPGQSDPTGHLGHFPIREGGIDAQIIGCGGDHLGTGDIDRVADGITDKVTGVGLRQLIGVIDLIGLGAAGIDIEGGIALLTDTADPHPVNDHQLAVTNGRGGQADALTGQCFRCGLAHGVGQRIEDHGVALGIHPADNHFIFTGIQRCARGTECQIKVVEGPAGIQHTLVGGGGVAGRRPAQSPIRRHYREGFSQCRRHFGMQVHDIAGAGGGGDGPFP